MTQQRWALSIRTNSKKAAIANRLRLLFHTVCLYKKHEYLKSFHEANEQDEGILNSKLFHCRGIRCEPVQKAAFLVTPRHFSIV
jgi:hypothetical protein